MSVFTSLKHVAVAIAVAGATLLPLTVNHDAHAEANAYVRVLHASPDAPAVEVFVDGAEAVRPVFPKVTPFLAVPAGSHHLQVFPAGAAYSAMGGVITSPCRSRQTSTTPWRRSDS